MRHQAKGHMTRAAAEGVLDSTWTPSASQQAWCNPACESNQAGPGPAPKEAQLARQPKADCDAARQLACHIAEQTGDDDGERRELGASAKAARCTYGAKYLLRCCSTTCPVLASQPLSMQDNGRLVADWLPAPASRAASHLKLPVQAAPSLAQSSHGGPWPVKRQPPVTARSGHLPTPSGPTPAAVSNVSACVTKARFQQTLSRSADDQVLSALCHGPTWLVNLSRLKVRGGMAVPKPPGQFSFSGEMPARTPMSCRASTDLTTLQVSSSTLSPPFAPESPALCAA